MLRMGGDMTRRRVVGFRWGLVFFAVVETLPEKQGFDHCFDKITIGVYGHFAPVIIVYFETSVLLTAGRFAVNCDNAARPVHDGGCGHGSTFQDRTPRHISPHSVQLHSIFTFQRTNGFTMHSFLSFVKCDILSQADGEFCRKWPGNGVGMEKAAVAFPVRSWFVAGTFPCSWFVHGLFRVRSGGEGKNAGVGSHGTHMQKLVDDQISKSNDKTTKP